MDQKMSSPDKNDHKAMTSQPKPVVHGISRMTQDDAQQFNHANFFRMHEVLGAHPMTVEGVEGTLFGVVAPNAHQVSVIGDFNGWDKNAHPLSKRWDDTGIWEGFVPGVKKGALYKYYVQSCQNGYCVDKCDPVAFYTEVPPQTSSIVWDLDYQWKDQEWLAKRAKKNALDAPMSVYEMHFGSWRRHMEEKSRSLTYPEMASQLISYIRDMGFTHVQFLPLTSYPFEGSWGYQTTGYFAPSSRYGSPQDLMYLIDQMHQNDIGVLMDWVPSHFPSDEHGLCYFDGTHLYEHADDRKGFHPDWKSYIFNYGRRETINFLISSAIFWLENYHIDGLRVDAVASMLYLDYSRNDGEWVPNQHGGRENLEAIDLLKRLNELVYEKFPDVQMIAEESTAWRGVSRPVYDGGLGFGMKWNMGWMHDTLSYFEKDPVFRKHHHNQLTFSIMYAFSENFMLSLSHDEVVHGKGSLLGKMPGDAWQKFANLRLLYGYMYGHPGKKLLFMGSELGQVREWDYQCSLDWHLLMEDCHSQLQKWLKDLNIIYQNEPALYQDDFSPNGWEWISHNDWQNSVLAFMRKGRDPKDNLVIVCNFTPVPRECYAIGVPAGGYWREILNSDASQYGGSGFGNMGGVDSRPEECHGMPQRVELKLPPLSMIMLKHDSEGS